MDYLEMTMRSLSNILYNCSQNPNAEKHNHALDSIKRMLQNYEEATGKKLNIEDHRE